MVCTFYSPWGQAETREAIKATVRNIGGRVDEISLSCIRAKWKSPYRSTIFPIKFTFYVGDGLVRVVSGNENADINITGLKVLSNRTVWDWFIVNLLKLYPDVDFGLKPGDAELVAVEFVGDGTEQVFVSNTVHSPSLSGAVLGGLLFGTPGAIIGSSYGTSHTTGKVSTQFAGTVLVRARYSNGLLAEGRLSKNTRTYNEIIVNMSRYSGG